MQDFFVRCDGKFIRVPVEDVIYLEALKNYVRIVTVTRNYLVLISMRQLEEELPSADFCRVHRSYIVSLRHILSFDHDMVYMKNINIPINPVYKSSLHQRVRVLISDTRTKLGEQLSGSQKEQE